MTDRAIAQTYSIRMQQIAEISEMSQATGCNPSEIVRQAIDAYYNEYLANVEKLEQAIKA